MSTVSEAYSADPNREWERLGRHPYSTLEFMVTNHFLRKHLPPGATILDAGGGPGRYAIELCRAGHCVTLFDLTPALLDTARAKLADEPEEVRSRLAELVQGDLRDLSRFSDGEFDAVMCLGGPISHFPVPEDRRRVVSQLVRVTKPGGLVFVGACGYLAVLRTIMMECPYELTNGVTDRLEQCGNGITWGAMDWHFFRADELRQLGEACGLTTVEMAGCQGLSASQRETTNAVAANEEQWRRWLEVVLTTASEPSVADMAEHILYIGRKA